MDNRDIHGALRLIQRSPDSGDGWRACSEVVWPMIKGLPTELVELESIGKAGRVRMTSVAHAVLKYS